MSKPERRKVTDLLKGGIELLNRGGYMQTIYVAKHADHLNILQAFYHRKMDEKKGYKAG